MGSGRSSVSTIVLSKEALIYLSYSSLLTLVQGVTVASRLTEFMSSAAPPRKKMVRSLVFRRAAVMRIFMVTRRTNVSLSFSYRPRLMYR